VHSHRCQYADGKPVKSKVFSKKSGSRDALDPEFHTELWLPIVFPFTTAKVKHSIWDRDTAGGDDLVCEFTTDLKVLKGYLDRGHTKDGPRWFNLYGAAVCPDPNALKNAVASASSALSGGSGVGEEKARMNRNPERGSTYRGRVLVTQRIVGDDKALKHLGEGFKPGKGGARTGWSRNATQGVTKLKHDQEPPVRSYVLRACVVSGVELPRDFQGAELSAIRACVVVSFGRYEFKTEVRTVMGGKTGGCAEWLWKNTDGKDGKKSRVRSKHNRPRLPLCLITSPPVSVLTARAHLPCLLRSI